MLEQTFRKPIDVANPGETVKPSSTGKGMLRSAVSKTRTPASWLRLGMYSPWFTNKSSVRPDEKENVTMFYTVTVLWVILTMDEITFKLKET